MLITLASMRDFGMKAKPQCSMRGVPGLVVCHVPRSSIFHILAYYLSIAATKKYGTARDVLVGQFSKYNDKAISKPAIDNMPTAFA